MAEGTESKSSASKIVKQFDLPERRSKIATLLKPAHLYCICKSSDSTRFMIACDFCEDWFHGNCVKIKKQEANRIERYYCPPCREKDPSLHIQYRQPRSARTKTTNSRSKGHVVSTRVSEGADAAAAGLSRSRRSSETESASPSATDDGDTCDCGNCDYCLNEEGSSTSTRGRGRQRSKRTDESKNKGARSKRVSQRQLKKERDEEEDEDSSDEDLSRGKSKAYKVTPDPQRKTPKPRKYSSSAPSSSSSTQGRPPKVQRKGQGQNKNTKGGVKKKSIGKRSTRRGTATTAQNQKSETSDFGDIEDSEGDKVQEVEEECRQCFGLDCILSAREGSKYCSDECGIKLATERLQKCLPSRMQNWNLTPTYAEEKNKQELGEVRSKMAECERQMSHWNQKRRDLDEHIEIVESIDWDEEALGGKDEPDEEGVAFCVTCGIQVPAKKIIKHMERCFNKCESRTNFGSVSKPMPTGDEPIFCDAFDKTHHTYCKRLKVLCPEHNKESKTQNKDDKVCGCPEVKNLVKCDTPKLCNTQEMCRRNKKNCNKHFNWEKQWRAEIDLERAVLSFKMDDLCRVGNRIRDAMANRGGVMDLLMHLTIDHEAQSKLIKEQAQLQADCKKQKRCLKGKEKEGFENEEEEEMNVDVGDEMGFIGIGVYPLPPQPQPSSSNSIKKDGNSSKEDDEECSFIFKKPLPPKKKGKKTPAYSF